MNTTPTAAINLPIQLLFVPTRKTPDSPLSTLLVPSPFPPAPVTFVGWGGLRGDPPGAPWPDMEGSRRALCRKMMYGVSMSADIPTGHRIVIGCERRTQWLKGHPERREAIDNLLVAIYHGMKAVHGPSVEVAYCGPEDAVCGDFTTPMLGLTTVYNPIWEHRNPMPFIAPRYGAGANEIAWAIHVVSASCGLSRGVILWMQETEPAAQQAVIEFGLKVDSEYGRIK